jgi:alanyl-tRNA synthetase
LRDSMSTSVRLLSVLPAELPTAIERLQLEARDQKRTLAALQGDLARYRADEYAAASEEVSLKSKGTDAGRCRLVARAIDGDAASLKTLAAAIVTKPGFVVVLVSTSTPAFIVVARSSGVELSSQLLVTQLIAEFGGKGGGRSELSQAGGLFGHTALILNAAISKL